MEQRLTGRGRPCSAAAALDLVGDRWSLLVVRELMFGNSRFDQLARNTGAPRDRLAARLRQLEDTGIVERQQYQDRPVRYGYALTEAGRALRPVLQALRLWGDKWATAGPPPMQIAHSCGGRIELVSICRNCGAETRPEEIVTSFDSDEWDVQGPVFPRG